MIVVYCGACGHAAHADACWYGADLTVGRCNCTAHSAPLAEPVAAPVCLSCAALRAALDTATRALREISRNIAENLPMTGLDAHINAIAAAALAQIEGVRK